jgi:membrane-bound metal-dependent hydrolase YbcI (DUF457 family)
MPDWVSHLGTAYLGARVARVQETQLVLLGAVLPDLLFPIFVVIELCGLPVSPALFAYVAPFHSATVIALLSLAIALLHVHPGRCFLFIGMGATTHFVLDAVATDIDCGMRLLYPFSFRSWSPGWLETGDALSIILLIVSAIVLAFALKQRARLAKVAFRVKPKSVVCAVLLAVLAFLLPLTTQQMVVNHNVHFLAFFANPSAWQERSVDLCFSEVVSTSPVAVKEFGRYFELVTTEDLPVAERVSVRGLFRDGRIYPTRLQIHRGFSEAWLSLAGLLALLALLIPSKRNGRVHAGRNASLPM